MQTNGPLRRGLLKWMARPLYFPRRLGLETLSLAHENDLEGVLVVVAREGGREGRTVLVESFSHHRFRALLPAEAPREFATRAREVRLRDQRPILFIESRGHGVRESLRPRRNQALVAYQFAGRAEEPGEEFAGPVGYDLLPLYDTLWKHALDESRANRAFSRFQLYDQFALSDFFAAGPARVGTVLRGRKRGRNRASAPWAWKNNGVEGQWFFDPARNVAERHHPRVPLETQYLYNRFLITDTGIREERGKTASRVAGGGSP
jgi:hypothetical protein